MSKRKPFYIWLLEQFVKTGKSDGGLGWIGYWLIGLVSIAFFDIAVLKSTGSSYFFGYIALTVLYLVVRELFATYGKYLKDTEPSPNR